ncbi:MAG TPA: ATP-dependent Clp protease proteolytic subunit [Candidatus Limnocylindrales bacterium]
MLRAPDLGELLQAQHMRRLALDASGVYFITEIDPPHAEDIAKSLLLMSSARAGQPDDPITLYINSGGGSVGDGLAIIEAINLMRRKYHVRIDTAILGYAYSMGAIVAQAGDTRSIGRFGTLMLHSSEWTVSGEDAKVFKDYQRLSEHYQEVMAALFAARTHYRDGAWWRRFIWSGRDRFLGPDECMELGLVDRIDEPSLVDEPGFQVGSRGAAPTRPAAPAPEGAAPGSSEGTDPTGGTTAAR